MMIDFKLLAKKVHALGLMEKPLSQYQREEMLQLVMALHTVESGQLRQCGTCWYQGWKGLKPCCLHPDHPVILSVYHWGALDCTDWSDWLDKELGPHKLIRKPKTTMDEVRVAPLDTAQSV